MAGVTLPRMLQVNVDFVTAADAMDAGDVVTATVELEGCVRDGLRPAILDQVMIIDKADQTAAAMTLFILNADVEVGAIDAAPDITDAEVEAALVAIIPIASTDFIDVGGAKVACIRNLGAICKAVDGSTSLYASLASAGTPTYGATSNVLHGKFSFIPN